ncbi:PL29 family lyase N-terminal domain-containing protein [Bacteroides congonensis]
MMKHFVLTLAAILLITGCSKDYDDTQLWENMNNLKSRVEKLEDTCNRLNTNIISLQAILEAIQKNDAIRDVSTLADGEGYLISFTSGKSITIYHGTNGLNGTDGEDGTTPNISVKQDSDGIYYWTVNGTWLLDSNNKKVKAVGVDGINGSNGKDGVTPVINVKQDSDGIYYWTVNNTWLLTSDGNKVKATGNDGTNGTNGKDGDSFFKAVVIKEGYAYFTLNNNENSILQIPFYTPNSLSIHIQEAGTLKQLLTNEQKRTVLSLKLTGTINKDDMKTINAQMLVLENLDLSETTYNEYSSFSINPYGTSLINRTLREIALPSNGYSSLYQINCLNLEKIIVTSNFYWNNADYTMCEQLNTVVFAEGITDIPDSSCGYFQTIILPSTSITVDYKSFSMIGPERPVTNKVICKAITPPQVGYIHVDGNFHSSSFYDYYKLLSEYTLLVPSESIELYKKANGWKQFGTITSMD